MELDLLERCRSGDRQAFAGLVSLWADRAHAVARFVSRDAASAEASVADAFIAAWEHLPSLHTYRAFGPWLMTQVTRAAEQHAPARSDDPLVEALRKGHADPRGADRALTDILAGGKRVAPLPATFYDDAVDARLSDTHLLEVSATTAAARALAIALQDPSAWCASKPRARTPLRPGSRMRARGALGSSGRTHDSTLVTLVDEQTLAWTTASRPGIWRASIEFRWSLVAAGDTLNHRLRGVAFPPGIQAAALHRAHERARATFEPSMRAGVERLARAVAG